MDNQHLYFIGLEPPQQITQEIRNIQHEFSQYNATKQLRIPVHLTLIPPFHAEASFESHLEDIADLMQKPVEIELRNFGNFNNKVIFIDVLTSITLIELRENLAHHLINNNIIPQLTSNFHPHITLANRDLTHKMCVVAWKNYKSRTFHCKFSVNRLSIYKHIDGIWYDIAK